MTKEFLLEELTYKMEALLESVTECEEAEELGIVDGVKECCELIERLNIELDFEERE